MRKQEHEKDVIAEGWHSNVDVKAISSLAGGFSYLKKYLLKGINFEKADSKALKTPALCWAYRKRAFSVSGAFRKLLADLIKGMHNSNHQMVQITLSGEKISEEKFYVLGFVSAILVQKQFLRDEQAQVSICLRKAQVALVHNMRFISGQKTVLNYPCHDFKS